MAAGETSSYRCIGSYPSGLAEVMAMVTGTIPEVATLTDEAEVMVEVFELGLSIEKTPPVQTIREGFAGQLHHQYQQCGRRPVDRRLHQRPDGARLLAQRFDAGRR